MKSLERKVIDVNDKKFYSNKNLCFYITNGVAGKMVLQSWQNGFA